MTDLPIACTLDAEALRARREGLLAGLAAACSGLDDLPDGVRLRFDGGQTLAAMAHVIDAERACCRFLHFAIAMAPDGGPVILDVTGPPGTREFLRALLTPSP
jgi:hypothetical protein